MWLYRDAVVVRYRGAVERQQLPAIWHFEVAVGNTQWLNCRRQRHHGELRNQQKADGTGEVGGRPGLNEWLARWQARRAQVGETPARVTAMQHANPIYIARNHQVEAALAAAVDKLDLAPFERLLAVLERPFDERPQDAAFAEPAPAETTAGYQTFCGT